MAFVNAGIKEIYMAANGNFPSALTNVSGLGIRNPGTFVISHINQQQAGLQNLQFPNMLNFKAECETFQVDNTALLTLLINGAKSASLATAVVTAGATNNGTSVSSSNGGVFVIDGSGTGMGVDFELNVGLNTRTLKVILERAYKYADGLTLISGSASDTVPFEASKLPMIDESLVIDGYVSPDFVPASLSTAFGDINIVDWNIKVATQGYKNGFNVSRVRGIDVELKATAEGLDVGDIGDLLTYEMISSDITIDLGTVNLVFKSKGLTRLGEMQINDEKREGTFTYMGRYDLDFVGVSSNTFTFNTFMQSGA